MHVVHRWSRRTGSGTDRSIHRGGGLPRLRGEDAIDFQQGWGSANCMVSTDNLILKWSSTSHYIYYLPRPSAIHLPQKRGGLVALSPGKLRMRPLFRGPGIRGSSARRIAI